MAKPFELTGHRFGRLLVLARDERNHHNKTWWQCRCDCGVIGVKDGVSLVRGVTLSCGCLRKEVVGARFTKHGKTKGPKWTPEYRAWVSMKTRCKYKNRKDYVNYGGRGISVCSEWESAFEPFLAHVGLRPSKTHSIDRIDVNGNYEPGNVRWATKTEQVHNRRKPLKLRD